MRGSEENDIEMTSKSTKVRNAELKDKASQEGGSE